MRKTGRVETDDPKERELRSSHRHTRTLAQKIHCLYFCQEIEIERQKYRIEEI